MFILATFIGGLFRELLFMIDRVVYTFIDDIYEVFRNVSQARINSTIVESFATTAYALISVYSLFIIAKLLINTIVNPDNFSDKQKGVGSVFTRLVMAVFGIVLLPFIFNLAYKFQAKIVDENIILKLIVGDKIDISTLTPPPGIRVKVNPGKQFKAIALTTLIRPDPIFAEYLPAIQAGHILSKICPSGYTQSTTTTCVDGTGLIMPKICPTGYFPISSTSTTCKAAVSTPAWYEPIGDCKETNDCAQAVYSYDNFLVNTDDMSSLASALKTRQKVGSGEKEFVLTYTYFAVTAVGVFIIYILLSFTIDLAIRVFKFGILEMVAPIFVATYVDNSEKSQFKKWLKLTISTYVDIFLKIVIMSLLLLFVSYLGDSSGEFGNLLQNGTSDGWLIKLLLLFGVLIFFKQAPKLFEELTGIKAQEGKLFGGSIKDKLGGAALIGKSTKNAMEKYGTGTRRAITGAAKRGTGSAVGGFIMGFRENKGKERITKGLKQGFGGLNKGIRIGGTEGYTAKDTKGYWRKGRRVDPKHSTLGEKYSDFNKGVLGKIENKAWDNELEKTAANNKKRGELKLPLNGKKVLFNSFSDVPAEGGPITFDKKISVREYGYDSLTGMWGITGSHDVETLSYDAFNTYTASADFKKLPTSVQKEQKIKLLGEYKQHCEKYESLITRQMELRNTVTADPGEQSTIERELNEIEDTLKVINSEEISYKDESNNTQKLSSTNSKIVVNELEKTIKKLQESDVTKPEAPKS